MKSSDFWQHVKVLPNGCWEWQMGRDRHGYGAVRIGRYDLKAHRVAWELLNGPIPAGLLACHKCDNPPCVRPAHLFLGTHRDNTQDALSKGRHVVPAVMEGASHANAKLTEDDVRQIRALRGVITQRVLGERFGVCQTHVGLIQRGGRWASTLVEDGNHALI